MLGLEPVFLIFSQWSFKRREVQVQRPSIVIFCAVSCSPLPFSYKEEEIQRSRDVIQGAGKNCRQNGKRQGMGHQ